MGVGADSAGLEFRPGQSIAGTWGKGQAARDKVIQLIAMLLEGASPPSHIEKVRGSGWKEGKRGDQDQNDNSYLLLTTLAQVLCGCPVGVPVRLDK